MIKHALLENVAIDSNGDGFFYGSKTENTCVVSIYHIDKKVVGIQRWAYEQGHFSYDAYGVLPPVSKLKGSSHVPVFSGYSESAGTELGVTEPLPHFQLVWSSFSTVHSTKYAEILGQKIEEQDQCVFGEYGWTGGAFGVGHRIVLKIRVYTY